jgi:hypothetical protein
MYEVASAHIRHNGEGGGGGEGYGHWIGELVVERKRASD